MNILSAFNFLKVIFRHAKTMHLTTIWNNAWSECRSISVWCSYYKYRLRLLIWCIHTSEVVLCRLDRCYISEYILLKNNQCAYNHTHQHSNNNNNLSTTDGRWLKVWWNNTSRPVDRSRIITWNVYDQYWWFFYIAGIITLPQHRMVWPSLYRIRCVRVRVCGFNVARDDERRSGCTI